jgi:hypothetical protein
MSITWSAAKKMETPAHWLWRVTRTTPSLRRARNDTLAYTSPVPNYPFNGTQDRPYKALS